MKSFPRSILLGAALLLGGFGLVAFAQEKAPEPAPAPAADRPPAPPAPAAEPAAPAEPASSLRRLDNAADERSTADELRQRSEEIRERTRVRREEERARAAERRGRRTGNAVVVPFGNAHLQAGEKADTVVAIFGNATAEGDVTDAVVAVFGNSHATGPVGDAVVAIFGNTTVNNHAKDVVAVFGDVDLGPNAVVDGEVVCIFGSITRDPLAMVNHQITNVGTGFKIGHGFRVWLDQCPLKGRLLAFGADLHWAWVVALSFLAFYVLLALLFPGSVLKGVETFEARPGFSALTALCTVVLAPITIVLLCITVVGVAVVPFLAMGLLLAGLFGKAVMLAWLGRRFTRLLGDGPLAHPVFAVLIGGLIVMALYTLPVVGLLTFKLLGWLGLGVVVYSVLGGSRRDKPAAVPATAAVASFVATPLAANLPPMTPPTAAPASVPASVVVATLPRAGFWIRVGALLLDAILVFGVCLLLYNMLPRAARFSPPEAFLLFLPTYGALMWKLRGTTIGGIICSLKVVRLDTREVDWATAIVRALSCFLSLAVAGFGFIWVAIDDEKQSWHDKIAGTTVVRVPKGISLL